MQPIQDRVARADFELLKKTLNAVARVAPERRPVLVVREVVNVTASADAAAFNRLFAALENAKQETRDSAGSFLFAVFLETSDYQWVSSSRRAQRSLMLCSDVTCLLCMLRSRINSPRSFQTFSIPPIAEAVAKQELVRCGLCTRFSNLRIYLCNLVTNRWIPTRSGARSSSSRCGQLRAVTAARSKLCTTSSDCVATWQAQSRRLRFESKAITAVS